MAYQYRFQQAPDSSGSPGTPAYIGTLGTSKVFSDTGLSPSTVYWFRTAVTDTLPTTVFSTWVSATTPAQPPAPPKGSTAGNNEESQEG